MHELLSIMYRLEGQATSQVTLVALGNSNAAHHIVDGLVAATHLFVVYRRGIVLQIDPATHHHGATHDPT